MTNLNHDIWERSIKETEIHWGDIGLNIGLIKSAVLEYWPELFNCVDGAKDDDLKRSNVGNYILKDVSKKLWNPMFYCISRVISERNNNEKWELDLFPFKTLLKRKKNRNNEYMSSLRPFYENMRDILSESLDDLPHTDRETLFSQIILSFLINDGIVNLPCLMACVKTMFKDVCENKYAEYYLLNSSDNVNDSTFIILSRQSSTLLRIWNKHYDHDSFVQSQNTSIIKGIIFTSVASFVKGKRRNIEKINNLSLLMEVCESGLWQEFTGATVNYCLGKVKTSEPTVLQLSRILSRGGL